MVMKAKYPVTYEGHPNQPETGDMLIWSGEDWVLIKGAYAELDPPSGNPLKTTWNCNVALNTKISVSESFTLEITNVVNGMSGDLVLNVTEGLTTHITITLDAEDDSNVAISDIKGNGVLTEMPVGIYHICWVYDGTRLTYNIARYAD